MIQVTPRASQAAEDLLRKRKAPDSVGLRLVKGEANELALVFGPAEPGDTAVPTAEEPVFIVAGDLAPEMANGVVDLTGGDDAAPRFVVRQPGQIDSD
jgi:hypothetical protein